MLAKIYLAQETDVFESRIRAKTIQICNTASKGKKC
jgi:hypothetical protein